MDQSSGPAAPTTPAAPAANANEGTSPADESAKRKRQPRNSACQPCAQLKMKCVPSAVAGKCERCHRMNRDCIAAVPKPRKRRAESNVGLESPAGFPVSGVAATNGSSYIGASVAPPPLPTRVSTDNVASHRHRPQDSLLMRPDVRHNGSHSFTALLVEGLRLDSPYILPGELLHGLDYNTAQDSLTVFRQLSNHFPFVYINPAEDAVLLVTQRPFTTLAICAVSAGANRSLQARLCYTVRVALSTKAIIEGEQNLDILIGLLIFVAWHHHYMDNHQLYQYLCLLAGMAEDLGLGLRNSGTSLEQDRAILGCYYLCSQLAPKALGKRNPLRWTDDLRRCADNVARAGSLPSDSNLVAITELASAIDDFSVEVKSDTLRSPAYTTLVEAHASMTTNRLKGLKHHYPTISANSSLAAALIDVYEKRLAVAPNNTSVMIRCVCDISEYIDDILNRPPIAMHQVTIVDWVNLLHILLLMVDLSKSLSNTGATGWEAGAVAHMLSPETILDRLCAHISNAASNDALAPRNDNLVRWFQSFCNAIKRNLIHGQQNRQSDTRFNSINSSPYVAQSASQPLERTNGVLDREFLRRFMDEP